MRSGKGGSEQGSAAAAAQYPRADTYCTGVRTKEIKDRRQVHHIGSVQGQAQRAARPAIPQPAFSSQKQ